MKKYPKISIVIPVLAINDYVRESIPKILELDWPDFEILIFPNDPDKKHHWPKTRIIPSIVPDPSIKRDLAIKHAKGEIYAFLDDDAYPEPDWLKKAIKHFIDPAIAAVGGPAITPRDDGTLQKVSGAVFESFLGGGGTRNRYLPVGKLSHTDDWPTVNLLVRANVFKQIGGFDNTYWPGEDTKLCLDIINAGYKIIHEPSAIVYHHRRSDLYKHFKQIGNYALHRGHFVKIYPKNSKRPFYFVPSFFNIYLAGLIIQAVMFPKELPTLILAIPLVVYILGLLIDALIVSWRWRNPLVGLITMPMIFFTHIWYGVRFVWGLAIPKLEK